MTKIAIITNIIPTYREGFYDNLLLNKNYTFTIFCQREIPNSTLKPIHDKFKSNVRLVRYFDFFNEKFNVQFLPFFELINNYDIVVVDGNPRYISHFLLASFMRFFLPKRVILWSMIRSYNANNILENIRLKWTKYFERVFVYNDNEADFLRVSGYKGFCLGMNNGLN